ncbi:unnamed protein product, partial [Polarella glacialis]
MRGEESVDSVPEKVPPARPLAAKLPEFASSSGGRWLLRHPILGSMILGPTPSSSPSAALPEKNLPSSPPRAEPLLPAPKAEAEAEAEGPRKGGRSTSDEELLALVRELVEAQRGRLAADAAQAALIEAPPAPTAVEVEPAAEAAAETAAASAAAS